MPNPTVPATAAEPPKCDVDADEIRERRQFERLYSAWHAALAASNDPARDDDDGAVAEGNNSADEAARLLFVTPAPLPWMVWWKLEAFEYYMSSDEGGCDWSDNRHIAFFGCLKADIMRFGIGREP